MLSVSIIIQKIDGRKLISFEFGSVVYVFEFFGHHFIRMIIPYYLNPFRSFILRLFLWPELIFRWFKDYFGFVFRNVLRLLFRLLLRRIFTGHISKRNLILRCILFRGHFLL